VYTVARLQQGVTICAIMYDVHGTNANTTSTSQAGGPGGLPSGYKEVTAGLANRNIDNGSEKNSGTPLGNTCKPIQLFNPGIDIQKTPHAQAISSNGTATFTITVTNTGNVTLNNVTVTDANTPDCAHTFASLAPGTANAQSYTCTTSALTTGLTNLAEACGTPAAGDPTQVCDTDTAIVNIEGFSTSQNVVPSDTLHISNLVAPISGNVTFELYKGTACTDTTQRVLSETPVGVTADGDYSTVNASTLQALSDAQFGANSDIQGTWTWNVVYSGGGTNAAQSSCSEHFSIQN
jgi:hypothetical protein